MGFEDDVTRMRAEYQQRITEDAREEVRPDADRRAAEARIAPEVAEAIAGFARFALSNGAHYVPLYRWRDVDQSDGGKKRKYRRVGSVLACIAWSSRSSSNFGWWEPNGTGITQDGRVVVDASFYDGGFWRSPGLADGIAVENLGAHPNLPDCSSTPRRVYSRPQTCRRAESPWRTGSFTSVHQGIPETDATRACGGVAARVGRVAMNFEAAGPTRPPTSVGKSSTTPRPRYWRHGAVDHGYPQCERVVADDSPMVVPTFDGRGSSRVAYLDISPPQGPVPASRRSHPVPQHEPPRTLVERTATRWTMLR